MKLKILVLLLLSTFFLTGCTIKKEGTIPQNQNSAIDVKGTTENQNNQENNSNNNNMSNTNKKTYDKIPPILPIEEIKDRIVTMDTNKGTIKIKLYGDKAPQTVSSFIFLTKEGFYDGLTFHRFVADFMIQGGDPTGTGSGGPGYQFYNEINADSLGLDEATKQSLLSQGFSFRDDLQSASNKRGTISMAHAGPGTNGSQFFINTVDNNFLDGKHTVFGEVIEGMDIVDQLRQGDTMTKVSVN